MFRKENIVVKPVRTKQINLVGENKQNIWKTTLWSIWTDVPSKEQALRDSLVDLMIIQYLLLAF